MKNKNHFSLVAIGTILSFLIASCNNETKEYTESPDAIIKQNAEDEISRGKYLVGIMGCNDCHSPKRMGENGPEIIPELLLSGYPSDRPVINFDSPLLKEGFGMFYPDLTAAAGPWGISFAGNITPDETGIGNWTEEQFKIALTKGKFKGMENARMLLPPMPWFNYVEMKDEDISAIFQYLQSIEPVFNIVPSPVSPEDM
jgi:mono/diheme cytochrome c family protein